MNDAIQAQNDPQQRKDFFAKSLNVFTTKVDTYFDMQQVSESDESYNWTIEELAISTHAPLAGRDRHNIQQDTYNTKHGHIYQTLLPYIQL